MSQPADPEIPGGGRPPVGPVPADRWWSSSEDPPVPADGRWSSDEPGQPASGGPAGTARPAALAVRLGAIAVTVAALGAPLGLLWSALAPAVPVRVTERGPIFGEAQPEQLVAAEGWFALLAVLFGVLVAFAGWFGVSAGRGVPGLLAVAIGALAAGLLAWWLGARIGLADYQAALAAAGAGDELSRPPDLRVAETGWWPPRLLGVPVVPALAATATYTMLAAWSRFPSLRQAPDRPSYGEPDRPAP